MAVSEPDVYDVIICGGGTAGCVLAARLTEDPNLQVLMIEAGDDANSDQRVTTPGLFTSLYGDPNRDWNYVSEPNEGLNGRRIPYPRGKCIGGSSAINVMALIYPSKTGLDTWAELGNKGWDWQNMAPYFRKCQTHVMPPDDVKLALGIDYLDDEFTGTSGPINASFPQYVDPLQQAWIETWKNLRRSGKSPLDGVGVGAFATPASVNLKTGQRSFAGSEYYAPASTRSNLHVTTKALIEKVELDASTPGAVKATGVVFSANGERQTVKARLEVILCAGTMGSPQILELSGIGCAEICNHLGIKNVVENANVGENLQDHLLCGISLEVKDGVQTADMFRDPAVIGAALQQYQQTRKGTLAAGGGNSFAYTPLVDFITPNPKEDLEELLDRHLLTTEAPAFEAERQHYAFNRKIILSPDETSGAMAMCSVQFHTGRPTIAELFALSEPENYISLVSQLSHPFSRGSIHIKSSSALDAPKITPNHLSHPLDAEILARHLMQCEKIADTEPLKSYLKPGGRRLPDGLDATSLQNALKLARHTAGTWNHPSGTCAMMPRDMGGVVNDRLVVHGTTNLRVIDASVFPIEPRGNIQSTVYAVAEKGADLVKEDLRRTQR